MMKYERLTYRRIRDGHAYAKAEYGDFEIVDRLAELEDKIEQGTLIELPCKVGDTVYCFNDYVWSDECGDCEHFEDGWFDSPCQCSKTRTSKKAAKCIEIEEAVGITLKAIVSYMADGQFGKTVFLTREEAEKRLKELQE